MKRDSAEFVSRYLTCQQIKAKHQRPGGLLQPLPIPSGSGSILLWILLLDSQNHFKVMILFG